MRSNPMPPSQRQQVLRKLPKVDEILSRPEMAELLQVHPRAVVLEAVRRGLNSFREELLHRDEARTVEDTLFQFDHLYPLFLREIERQVRPRLRQVINATGVVIHTNLGRSPLSPSALEHMIQDSRTYSNLPVHQAGVHQPRPERQARLDPDRRHPHRRQWLRGAHRPGLRQCPHHSDRRELRRHFRAAAVGRGHHHRAAEGAGLRPVLPDLRPHRHAHLRAHAGDGRDAAAGGPGVAVGYRYSHLRAADPETVEDPRPPAQQRGRARHLPAGAAAAAAGAQHRCVPGLAPDGHRAAFHQVLLRDGEQRHHARGVLPDPERRRARVAVRWRRQGHPAGAAAAEGLPAAEQWHGPRQPAHQQRRAHRAVGADRPAGDQRGEQRQHRQGRLRGGTGQRRAVDSLNQGLSTMRYIPKIPKGRGLNEPILHADHAKPVSRRDFLSAGLITGSATVVVPTVAGLLASRGARADVLADLAGIGSAGCGITGGAGKIPFICFDLSGGANLAGSNILIGKQGGQLDFLTTAGYSKLGLPGNMTPNLANQLDQQYGAAFHIDSAILRGMNTRTQVATRAGVNGTAIAARSENDTGNNPHNPMYGIARTGARGELLTLIGSVSSDSGGNSMAPAMLIDPKIRPTKVDRASDVTGLVDTGELGSLFPNPADAVSVMESMAVLTHRKHAVVDTRLGASADASIKQFNKCGYVKSAYLAERFNNPASLNPGIDPRIVGPTGIFTQAEYDGDGEI